MIETLSENKDISLPCAEAWGEWLAEQQRVALDVYQLKPSQLVADQRREQGISRDYEGREILELLQNAADAASKACQRGKVRIQLSPQGLLVANTGVGFTTGGVASLQTADLSPKRGKHRKMIGSKGLGFRAVLNWSRQPIILSGALELAYDMRYAEQLIEELARDSAAVQVVVEDETTLGGSPIPLLPFPLHLNSSSARPHVAALTLLEKAETLKAQGFDTVVAMPFDRPQDFEHACDQLQQLRPEFLFFAEWIETLSVCVSATGDDTPHSDKTWSLSPANDGVVVLSAQDHATGDETSQRWRLFSDGGEIPAQLLRASDDPDHYHLVVALLDDGLAKPANLYSFFPTSIPLPLHALCHATLELEQNRKHLQAGEANTYVLKQLARFLARLFTEQIKTSGDAYRAIDLLAPEKLSIAYAEDIRVLQKTLIEEIKSSDILHTVSKTMISAVQADCFPDTVDALQWLPPAIFPTVIVARDNRDKRLFDLLGVSEISGPVFIGKLFAAELTLQQRADIALGLVDSDMDSEFCDKRLFLDTSGNVLSENDSLYQPGSQIGEDLVFPGWANVKILHPGLWELLRGNKVRDSVKTFEDFGLQEYSLANLIASLVSAANRAVGDLEESVVRSELIRSLYGLYRYAQKEKRMPAFPINPSAKLPNQKNEWIGARDLYFGSGYSIHGEIMCRLYHQVPKKLVASPGVFHDIGIDKYELEGFLRWVGVRTWPKVETLNKADPEFLKFVLPRLQFPAVFMERDSHKFDTVDDLPSNCKLVSVESLDGLEKIVKADSDAIIAWLAHDDRSRSWLRPASSHGKLSFTPTWARNERVYKGVLPSYIHWKIKHSTWLKSAEGKALAPIECMVNDAAVAGLFPTPVLPAKEAMETFALDGSSLKYAWLNAGIKEGIEDLGSEDIYALLLKLPKLDPQGGLAKKLYNWLIKTVDFDLDEQGKNYLLFKEKGKILAQYGDETAYFSVAEVYHVDVEGFPSELLRTLPVACLLKKRGAGKVSRIFGVNVLDKQSVNEKVVHQQAAACSEQANEQFQLSKRYIEIYRHNHSAKPSSLSVFNQLQLIVCKRVQTEIMFREEKLNSVLPPWTYSIQGERFFISCDPMKETDSGNPLLANAISDALASLFGLTEGTPFAQIYQCDEANRAELLAKMLGDELDDDLDAELQRLKDEIKGQGMPGPVVTMGPVVPPAPSAPTEPSPPLSQPSAGAPVPKLNSGEWNIPASIAVERLEHKPTQPGKPVSVRISSGGGGSGSGRTVSISDGKAGERLVMLFEEQQGRFPLMIGHITGYETIAADVLSFRTDKDRALFESGNDQNASLIERVIEAKGQVVKLTNNEVNAASEWKDKYYIYQFRLLNAADAEYELVLLKNPLNEKSAIASTVEVSLDRAKSVEKFLVTGND